MSKNEKLVKWQPKDPVYLDRLRDWEPKNPLASLFESIFSIGDFGPQFLSMKDRGWFNPKVDIEETKDSYIVKADLPGLEKESIQVNVSDDILTIRGERKTEREDKSKTHYRIERQYGSFERSFQLPEVIVE